MTRRRALRRRDASTADRSRFFRVPRARARLARDLRARERRRAMRSRAVRRASAVARPSRARACAARRGEGHARSLPRSQTLYSTRTRVDGHVAAPRARHSRAPRASIAPRARRDGRTRRVAHARARAGVRGVVVDAPDVPERANDARGGRRRTRDDADARKRARRASDAKARRRETRAVGRDVRNLHRTVG